MHPTKSPRCHWSISATVLLLMIAWTAVAWTPAPALAQPTMTSYQGQLAIGGAPYSGTANFKFVIFTPIPVVTTLWSNDNTSTGGLQPTTAVPVSVSNGSFSVYLGMPPMYPLTPDLLAPADQALLRVWVDTGSGFTLLTDQPIGSSPYTLHSRSAEISHGTFVAHGLIESTLDGFKFPDGTIQTTAAATSGTSWSLTGNAGTDPTNNYLGTSDDVDLRIKVGGRHALRIEPTGLDDAGDPLAPNLIGGRYNNSVTDGVYGATIGGGGAKDNEDNLVTDLYGTVGGGASNLAGNNDEFVYNATHATVGGGYANRARGWYATVAGGLENHAAGLRSSVGGGVRNTANGASSTISGGYENSADGNDATIAGGYQNNAGGQNASVGGGSDNHANGDGSTIPGGVGNFVTTEALYGFAAGRNARANEEGAFVWADNSSDLPFDSNGPNTFCVRSAGGVKVADADGVVKIKLNPTTQTITTPILEILGGSDLAEPFPMSDSGPLAPGSVVVIDRERPGELRLSTTPYDSRVAGVVSGAGGVQPGLTLRQAGVMDGDQHVALTGRVYVLAVADEAPIQPGDLLTTSSVPGHAMAATDPDRRAGTVIGKAMSTLDRGRGLVLVLVSLQ